MIKLIQYRKEGERQEVEEEENEEGRNSIKERRGDLEAQGKRKEVEMRKRKQQEK